MRKIAEGIELSFSRTMSVGAGTPQFIGLSLDNDEGIILRSVEFSLATTSAAPSVTGAGLSLLQVVLYGKSQELPTELISVDRLIAMHNFAEGSIAAGPITMAEGQVVLREDMYTHDLYINDFTANITNAATTVLRVLLKYDRYRLTDSELVALL